MSAREAVASWTSGCWPVGSMATGYPIIDAGMRQLRRTGWMHNRVRMIAASFLIKHLLQPWQDGEAWSWDTLVDARSRHNAGNWQWVAGCGRDAAPYFRIFNPVTQGQRFDANGAYVRRWLPELSRLSDRWIHRPWDAPATECDAAGVPPRDELSESPGRTFGCTRAGAGRIRNGKNRFLTPLW